MLYNIIFKIQIMTLHLYLSCIVSLYTSWYLNKVCPSQLVERVIYYLSPDILDRDYGDLKNWHVLTGNVVLWSKCNFPIKCYESVWRSTLSQRQKGSGAAWSHTWNGDQIISRLWWYELVLWALIRPPSKTDDDNNWVSKFW